MATSLLLMASDEPTSPETQKSLSGSDEPKPENVKHRVRKNAKPNASSSHKKQPQRGMGVAQLERLRLQERWKRMTEINQLQCSLNLHPHFHYQLPSPIADPPTRVPIQFTKFGPVSGGVGGVGPSTLHQAVLLQRLGNGGFHGSAGGSGVGGGAFSDQFQVDPYGFGASDSRFRVGNAFETSKELSSIPKMQCLSNHYDVSIKKKRTNEENLGFNGGRDKYAENSPIDSCDFLRLNLGNDRDFDARARRVGNAGRNVDQEVEVVAIHRKGNSVVGGSVLMEYEFFPGKGGRSTSYKELKLGAEASVGVAGEASLITTTTTTSTPNASNSVDLSLKLSY